MRKLFIPLILLINTYTASAQQICETIYPDCIETGIYKDFNAPEGNSRIKIYPFGDTINSSLASPDPSDPNPGFYAPFVIENGKLTYSITTPLGGYIPVGIHFGINPKTHEPNTIDLSQNASFAFRFINNSESQDIRVRLSIQDINDSVIDSYERTNVTQAYLGIIEKTLLKGSQLNWEGKQTTNPKTNNSFARGAHTRYQYTPLVGQEVCPWTSNPATVTTNFDFTKVKRILFIFINSSDAGANCYNPRPMSNVSVSIDSIRIGNVNDGTCEPYLYCSEITATRKSSADLNVSVFPNPAKQSTTVNYAATENALIRIYSLDGNLVKSVKGNNSTATINTSDLTSGIYMLSVEIDGQPSKAEKLIIE